MSSPKFEPDKWDDPKYREINNCYNYATNKRFKPGDKRKYPGPAEPGRSAGITVGVNIGFDVNAKTVLGTGEKAMTLFGPAVEITCKGLKTACMADGMQEAKDGPKCKDPDCWLVAYYRKPAKKFGTSNLFWHSADYHFVRQDADGKWSHKPGFGNQSKVTRNQYNKAKNDFSGKPITDPAKSNVGDGYEFCGYLCVCPKKITVASADIPNSGLGHHGAMLASADSHGRASRTLIRLEGTDFTNTLEAWSRQLGCAWTPGYGEGSLRYRLDVGDEGCFAEFSLLVYDRSIAVWDGQSRHLPDPEGLVARDIQQWYGPREVPILTADERGSARGKSRKAKGKKAKGMANKQE